MYPCRTRVGLGQVSDGVRQRLNDGFLAGTAIQPAFRASPDRHPAPRVASSGPKTPHLVAGIVVGLLLAGAGQNGQLSGTLVTQNTQVTCGATIIEEAGIGGYLLNLHGRLSNAAGAALAGKTVTVCCKYRGCSTYEPLPAVTTGADGTYAYQYEESALLGESRPLLRPVRGRHLLQRFPIALHALVTTTMRSPGTAALRPFSRVSKAGSIAKQGRAASPKPCPRR